MLPLLFIIIMHLQQKPPVHCPKDLYKYASIWQKHIHMLLNTAVINILTKKPLSKSFARLWRFGGKKRNIRDVVWHKQNQRAVLGLKSASKRHAIKITWLANDPREPTGFVSRTLKPQLLDHNEYINVQGSGNYFEYFSLAIKEKRNNSH